MKCWKCSHEIETPLARKVAFRAECEKCFSSLHCCYACKFYKPGMKNDCMVPGTEYVCEKSAMNLCEEFSYQEKQMSQTSTSSEDAKKKFDDLFR